MNREPRFNADAESWLPEIATMVAPASLSRLKTSSTKSMASLFGNARSKISPASNTTSMCSCLTKSTIQSQNRACCGIRSVSSNFLPICQSEVWRRRTFESSHGLRGANNKWGRGSASVTISEGSEIRDLETCFYVSKWLSLEPHRE